MSTIHARGNSVNSAPPLDEFRKSAAATDLVAVRVDDTGYRVLGTSQFNSDGRLHAVNWVQGETDTTAVFLQTLSQAYGPGLSTAIARELSLAPAPGAPMASRTVRQALEYAETGRSVLAGVDFLTFLDHSPVHRGGAFNALAQGLGLNPGSLDIRSRQRIDDRLREQFALAAARGDSPVTPHTAREMLLKELKLLTN